MFELLFWIVIAALVLAVIVALVLYCTRSENDDSNSGHVDSIWPD